MKNRFDLPRPAQVSPGFEPARIQSIAQFPGLPANVCHICGTTEGIVSYDLDIRGPICRQCRPCVYVAEIELRQQNIRK